MTSYTALQHWANVREALAAGDAFRATAEAVAAKRAEAAARGIPFDEVFGNPEGQAPRVGAVLSAKSNVLGIAGERWTELREEIAFACLLGDNWDEAAQVALLGVPFAWPQFERERQAFKDAGKLPVSWKGAGERDWKTPSDPFRGFAALSRDARRVLVYNAAIGREAVGPRERAQWRSHLLNREFDAALMELEAAGLARSQLLPRDRLMLLALRELEPLAAELGLPRSGGKAGMADRIATRMAVEDIDEHLRDLGENCIWLCLDVAKGAKREALQEKRLLSLLSSFGLVESHTRATMDVAAALRVDLVQLDVHHDACHMCRRVQGKAFSISGRSSDFPALTQAISPPLHIGCRHILLPAPEEFLRAKGQYERLSQFSLSDAVVADALEYHQIMSSN